MCPLKSLRWILKTFKYKSYSPINVSNVFKSVYLYFLKSTMNHNALFSEYEICTDQNQVQARKNLIFFSHLKSQLSWFLHGDVNAENYGK